MSTAPCMESKTESSETIFSKASVVSLAKRISLCNWTHWAHNLDDDSTLSCCKTESKTTDVHFTSDILDCTVATLIQGLPPTPNNLMLSLKASMLFLGGSSPCEFIYLNSCVETK